MKKFILALSLMLISIGVYAQSADVITQILETEKITYGQISYLSAVRQDLISEEDSFDKAMEVLSENFHAKKLFGVDYPAPAEDVASIIMTIWPEVKGGLLCRISGGSSRYMFKYLKAVHCIPDNCDPQSYLSGIEALNILTFCMDKFGAEDECMSMDVE